MVFSKGFRVAAASLACAVAVFAVVTFGGTAFGESAQAEANAAEKLATAQATGADVIDGYPEDVVTAVVYYRSGMVTADELVNALGNLAQSGVITDEELDELEILLAKGALDASDDAQVDDGASADDESGEAADDGDAAVDDGADDSGDGSDAGDADSGDAAGGAEADGGDSDAGASDADSSEAGTSDDGSGADADSGSEDGTASDGADEDQGDGSSGDASADSSDSESSDNSEAADSSSESTSIPSSGTYTSTYRVSQNLTTVKFIALIGEQARQIGQEYGLYSSVMIAQAILESGSGNSTLSQAPNNNLFGIKGSWRGNYVAMRTTEDDGTGLLYAEIAKFRKYDSITDSLEDYATLLTQSMGSYYSGAWKANASTYEEACDYLQGRYATDTSYSSKLKAIIEAYDLTRYDEPLGYELDGVYERQAVDASTGDALYDESGNPVMEQLTLADLLACATSQLGIKYVWGGSSPDEGFDCSGLVQYSYEQVFGLTLPRTTQEQWQVGEVVQFSDLHPGDLLFFESGGDVGHVGIYLGEGCYIQAPHTGDVVKVTSMDEYTPTFAVRILSTHTVDAVVEEPVQEEEAPVVEEAVQEVVYEVPARIFDYSNITTYVHTYGTGDMSLAYSNGGMRFGLQSMQTRQSGTTRQASQGWNVQDRLVALESATTVVL